MNGCGWRGVLVLAAAALVSLTLIETSAKSPSLANSDLQQIRCSSGQFKHGTEASNHMLDSTPGASPIRLLPILDVWCLAGPFQRAALTSGANEARTGLSVGRGDGPDQHHHARQSPAGATD